MTPEQEALGRKVRAVWNTWAEEQGAVGISLAGTWETANEKTRQLDIFVANRLFAKGEPFEIKTVFLEFLTLTAEMAQRTLARLQKREDDLAAIVNLMVEEFPGGGFRWLDTRGEPAWKPAKDMDAAVDNVFLAAGRQAESEYQAELERSRPA